MTPTPDSRRRSYTNIRAFPAWGLYAGTHLVASIRAENAYVARDIFKEHNLEGERVRRIPEERTGG